MSLFDLIRAKNSPGGFANAKAANPAKTGQSEGLFLATLATLALAKPRDEKSEGKPGSRRLWLIAFPDLPRGVAAFCPPKTREEVLGWHPGALSVEPYKPPPEGPLNALAINPALVEVAYVPL